MSLQTFISRIQVKNYRSIADIDIKLGPLTVLVGPNGSGKSNLIDALRFTRDIINNGLDIAILIRNGIDFIQHQYPKKQYHDIQIKLYIENTNWHGEYSFVVEIKKPDTYNIKQEHLHISENITDNKNISINNFEIDIKEGSVVNATVNENILNILDILKNNHNYRLSISTIANIIPYTPLKELHLFLRDMGFYNIYPINIRGPQSILNPNPLAEDGRNLASVLRSLKTNHNENGDVDTITSALSQVVEDIHDYSVSEIGGFLVTELQHNHPENQNNNLLFPLAQESDGTLRILGILAALYQDPPRSLVAIEEPELAIHPGALGVLCDVLQEASHRSQIMITTHNPDLIDKFSEDTILVVEKEQGITKVGPIIESQKDIIRQKLFSPGELMRIQGLRRQQE